MILTSHQPNFLPYMGVIYKAFTQDCGGNVDRYSQRFL